MPVYTYRREDGSTFEYRQSFKDDPLTVCPDTGQKAHRVVQPTGIIFKGSGFYVNDYRKGANGAQSKNGKSEPKSEKNETSSETKTKTSGETKASSKTSQAESAIQHNNNA